MITGNVDESYITCSHDMVQVNVMLSLHCTLQKINNLFEADTSRFEGCFAVNIIQHCYT